MNLLQMSLAGAVFIFAAALIRALTIRKLPKITFLVLWYIAMARLILPVRIPLGIDSGTGAGLPAQKTLERGVLDFAAGLLQSTANSEGDTQMVQNSQRAVSAFPLLFMIWVLGAVFAAGFLTLHYLRCRREFQTALPVEKDVVSDWLCKHPLKRRIKIRQLAGLATPLTYGIFHPVIVIPKEMEWEANQVPYILFHEYVHIRRFDAAGKWIAAVVLCIHWFNPLVWVLYVLFNRDIELSCDECVIRHFGEENRRNYAMTLLCMEERRNITAPFGNYFSKNIAEERIKTIMRCRKKTIFSLLSAAALVVAGTAAVFIMPVKTGNAGSVDIWDILEGNEPFLYVSAGVAEEKKIADVPSLFDPDDAYMKIQTFAVIDLDGDENPEIVLSVMGMAGDMGGSLILHQIGDRVYGYRTGYRDLTDLKADGTYNYSDPTGMVEGGIASIASFAETGCTVDKIAYARGNYEGWDTFVVNHQSATEEEFQAAQNAQSEKPDAVWFDFVPAFIPRPS